MSSVTRICPSQAADAPIPIVNTLEDFAIDAATGSTMPSMTIPKTPASAPPASAPATTENDNHITIKSPIIGTFYRKPSPDKPNFVEAGDQVNTGDVLCVVEAMKLFNEIESELSGTIVKILVDDSSPVEFDQPLFIIDPS